MSDITPITREEMYYNEILGNDEDISPITRTEIWLDKIAKNTTSSEPEATTDGTYTDTIDGSLFIKSIYGMSVQDGIPTPSEPVMIEDSLGNFTVTDSDATNTQTITTGITLRAIEVTSSDAYNLEYDGKYYISDSIDWVDGTGYVLTQRCYVADTLTATGVADRTASTEIAFTVPTAFDNTLRAYNISTHFVFAISGQATGTFLSFTNDTTIIHAFVTLGEVTTVAEAQSWLDDNNVEFLLALKTPTTTPLTTAQTTALLGLVTYDGSTTITGTSDPACLVEVEYGPSKLVNQVIKNKIDIALLKLEE